MNSVAQGVTLACLWEATAPKPGNVYRGADFADMSYADFVTAAAVIGPPLAEAADIGVGPAILAAVEAMWHAVGVNTSLGTIVLLGPLAAVPPATALPAGIVNVLDRLDSADTRSIYQAIRLVQPGGLGRVDQADVNDAPPDISLRDAMQLAAKRDLVARQYVNSFADVFWLADQIAASSGPLSARIVMGYLNQLAREPDSLVVRKCGADVGREVAVRAAHVLEFSGAGSEYEAALADFDFWLRAEGHRRNPGTSADLVAAALYVLLREGGLEFPVRFYR